MEYSRTTSYVIETPKGYFSVSSKEDINKRLEELRDKHGLARLIFFEEKLLEEEE
jgi:hypothetical protein